MAIDSHDRKVLSLAKKVLGSTRVRTNAELSWDTMLKIYIVAVFLACCHRHLVEGQLLLQLQ